MSMMVSFVLSFFPRDVLDEILNLIESVSEDFPSYSFRMVPSFGLKSDLPSIMVKSIMYFISKLHAVFENISVDSF